MIEGPKAQFSGGRVFAAALGVWRENAFVLTGTAFVANLGIWMLGELFRAAFGPALIWLDLMLDAALNGVIVLMAQDALTGGGIRLRPHLERVREVLGPVIVLSVAATLAVGVGLALFIVPGIYLASVWMAAQPALLLERDVGWRALARSFELAQPHAWGVAGVILRAGLTVGVAAVLVVMLMVSVSEQTSLAILATGVAVLASSCLGTFIAIVSLLVYLRLRELTDGGDVSDVFG